MTAPGNEPQSDSEDDPQPRHDPTFHYVGVLPFGWCPCGWEGPTRDHQREAADDIRAHRRETADG